MALNSLGLGVTFTARDAMSGTLFRLQRAFQGLELQSKAAVAMVGAGFASMAIGIGVMSAGLAGIETSMNLASAAGRFEQQVARAGAVSEASGEQLEALRRAALNASIDTHFKTEDTIRALTDITAMGFTAAESIAMLKPALDLAAGGEIAVADAADAMSSAIKVFSLQAADATMVADKLLKISNLTSLQAGDLRLALGTVGRGASAAKQGLDEMLISMGLVKNTGVDTSVAASSVSVALTNMSTHGDRFKKLGVEVTNSEGKFRDFLDIVLDVNSAMDAKNMTDQERGALAHDLFSSRGMASFQGILTQLKTGVVDSKSGEIYKMADAVTFLRESMGDAAGTADAFTSAIMNTYEGAKSLVDSNLDVLAVQLGDGFKELFKPILFAGVKALQELNRWLLDLSPSVKRVGAALFVGASIFTAAAGAALILAGAITALAGIVAFAGAPVLMWMAGFAAVALPLIAMTALLTGAILTFGAGLAYAFGNNLGGITDKVTQEFGRWKLMFAATAAFLSEGKLSGALADEFMKSDNATQQFIVSTVLFFEKVKAAVGAFFDQVQKYGPVVSDVLTALGRSFLGITDALGLTDGSMLKFGESLDKNDFATQGRLIADAMVKAFLMIALSIETVNNAITDLINLGSKAIEWVPDVFGGLRVAGAAGLLPESMRLAVEGIGAFADASANEPAATPRAFYGKPAPLPTAPNQSMPASADAEVQGEAQGAQADLFAKILAMREGRGATMPPIHTHLHLDGQQIAESVTNAQRDNQNSSYASDGGYSE